MPDRYSDGAGGTVLVLHGAIDRERARALESILRDVALSPTPTAVLDISDVDEVNGALLGLLVRATRWIGWRNGRTVIVCGRDDLRRGLEVAGLDHLAEVRAQWPEVTAERRARFRSGTPAPPSRAC
jgi:anti-anti-sigma factor